MSTWTPQVFWFLALFLLNYLLRTWFPITNGMFAAEDSENGETTHALEVRGVFDSLVEEKSNETKNNVIYAHHLARACWHGTRIILRQTSPEAEGIFDFILELHKACSGRWNTFCDNGIQRKDLDAWLEFCGLFMSNLGNYFLDGNRKAIPNVSKDTLRRFANISSEATSMLEEIVDDMMATQPTMIGYPDETSQSNYYPGKLKITAEEIDIITDMIEDNGIGSENTRLQKLPHAGSESFDSFHVLQASAEKDDAPKLIGEVIIGDSRIAKIFLCRGDHSEEMEKVCLELLEARKYSLTAEQQTELLQLVECFKTGDYKTAFWSSLKTWVKDKNPRVEHSIGWLSAYRDLNSARTDWQATVGITDGEETKKMSQLVAMSTDIIRTLPWAIPGLNDGKGPFEHANMNIPDFSIIHVLAFACSTFWEAATTNLNDVDGINYGAKNIIFGNRMSLNNRPGRPCYYVHPSDSPGYMDYVHIVRFNGTVIHELIGHGSGKLLTEHAPGEFNFDHENLPLSPITGAPIRTWYRPKENWNSVFGTLAFTVEECRAFLFAYYLTDNEDILAVLGYDQHSTPSADDLLYYTYLHMGVEGLRALRSFKVEDQAWNGDHDQALFAILKHILQDGGGVLSIEHNLEEGTLFVRVDRSKIISHGKPSIGRMLCKIHIWHSTADIEACRPFYNSLSVVDREFEAWRKIVASNPEPKWKFVQPNTFLKGDGTVELREYDASNEGIIHSFFDRMV